MAGIAAGAIGLPEALEHLLALRGWNAPSLIIHPQLHEGSLHLESDQDGVARG